VQWLGKEKIGLIVTGEMKSKVVGDKLGQASTVTGQRASITVTENVFVDQLL
jgi:hypothetical protein